jgi:hypothetical protein
MDSLLARAKQALAQHRQTTAGLTETPAEVLAMPLEEFARAGLAVQVSVPWWPTPLWFVGTPEAAGALAQEGIPRATIWTAAELLDVLQVAPDHQTLRTLAAAKHLFDGDLSLSSLPSPPGKASLLSPSSHTRVRDEREERERQGEKSKAEGETSERSEGSGEAPA